MNNPDPRIDALRNSGLDFLSDGEAAGIIADLDAADPCLRINAFGIDDLFADVLHDELPTVIVTDLYDDDLRAQWIRRTAKALEAALTEDGAADEAANIVRINLNDLGMLDRLMDALEVPISFLREQQQSAEHDETDEQIRLRAIHVAIKGPS
jgi:hypothetical protein